MSFSLYKVKFDQICNTANKVVSRQGSKFLQKHFTKIVK